jgi:hypothetical protein
MPIKDSDVYPVGTVVRIKRTNEFAIIKTHTFQHFGRGFLNYLVEKEGKHGLYCAFHDDIEVEHLPPVSNGKAD